MTPLTPYLALTNVAAVYIGTREEGVNRGPLVERFQRAVDGKAQGEPWCAAFVAFCLAQVEEMFHVKHSLSLSEHCLTLWRSNPKAVFKAPQAGFIAVWRRRGSSQGHAGIVVGVSGGGFQTIEGNTSGGPGFEREGDGVFRKAHTLSPKGSFELLGFLDPYRGVDVQANAQANIS